MMLHLNYMTRHTATYDISFQVQAKVKVKDYMKNTLKSKNGLASISDKIRCLEDDANCQERLALSGLSSKALETIFMQTSYLGPGLSRSWMGLSLTWRNATTQWQNSKPKASAPAIQQSR